MKTIPLLYGRGRIDFTYDPDRFDVLLPSPLETAMEADEIVSALRRPIESRALGKLAASASTALIIISDATRTARSDLLLPPILRELNEGGISNDRVAILVALGNHRLATEEEILSLVGEDLLGKIRIEQHDSRNPDELVDMGVTSRGTQVKLNRLLLESDLVVTVSAVTAHYFAGFGGGRKSIFPGVAGRDGIVRNHLLGVDFKRGRMADGVEAARLKGNPINEDMLEAAAYRPPDFAVNALLTTDYGIGAVFAGHWVSSHLQACERFMSHHGIGIGSRRPLVIASCGGHPKDIDLIQSHKTIQYAARALQPGGTLLLLAHCGDGLGSRGFDHFFPAGNILTLLDEIRLEKRANGQTALALYQKTQEFRIVMVSDLPPDTTQAMGIELIDDPQAVMAELSSALPPGTRGYIIPEGALTLPEIL